MRGAGGDEGTGDKGQGSGFLGRGSSQGLTGGNRRGGTAGGAQLGEMPLWGEISRGDGGLSWKLARLGRCVIRAVRWQE